MEISPGIYIVSQKYRRCAHLVEKMLENIELSEEARINYQNNLGFPSSLLGILASTWRFSSNSAPGEDTAVFPLTWQGCKSAFWESSGT